MCQTGTVNSVRQALSAERGALSTEALKVDLTLDEELVILVSAPFYTARV